MKRNLNLPSHVFPSFFFSFSLPLLPLSLFSWRLESVELDIFSCNATELGWVILNGNI